MMKKIFLLVLSTFSLCAEQAVTTAMSKFLSALEFYLKDKNSDNAQSIVSEYDDSENTDRYRRTFDQRLSRAGLNINQLRTQAATPAPVRSAPIMPAAPVKAPAQPITRVTATTEQFPRVTATTQNAKQTITRGTMQAPEVFTATTRPPMPTTPPSAVPTKSPDTKAAELAAKKAAGSNSKAAQTAVQLLNPATQTATLNDLAKEAGVAQREITDAHKKTTQSASASEITQAKHEAADAVHTLNDMAQGLAAAATGANAAGDKQRAAELMRGAQKAADAATAGAQTTQAAAQKAQKAGLVERALQATGAPVETSQVVRADLDSEVKQANKEAEEARAAAGGRDELSRQLATQAQAENPRKEAPGFFSNLLDGLASIFANTAKSAVSSEAPAGAVAHVTDISDRDTSDNNTREVTTITPSSSNTTPEPAAQETPAAAPHADEVTPEPHSAFDLF